MRRFLLPLSLLMFLFPSCEKNEARVFTSLDLNTICSITVYEAKDEEFVQGAFDLMKEIAGMIDMYDEDSELSNVNRNAYQEDVYVSDELFSLLSYAYSVTEYTFGAFNLAIGPLVRLWAIGSEEERVPSSSEIEEVLPLLDWRNISLDEDEKSVRFLKEGMAIDLGAVGKGYISDVLASYFEENGVESAIINLGGNVYAVGTHPSGRAWTIGLQNPDTERGGYYTTVECSDSAVVTSGGYERYFIAQDGQVYHHILDYKTGYPASSDIVSSSIITEDATLADMLSTACFALGSDKAADIVRHYNVKAVFLLKDGSTVRIGI